MFDAMVVWLLRNQVEKAVKSRVRSKDDCTVATCSC